MEKSFKRKSNIHIIIAILGLILIINTIRIQNYLWLFDGIVLVVSIIALGIGIWGLLVPYVKIDENYIRIYPSIMKNSFVKIGQIKEFYADDSNNTIELRTEDKTYEINLKNIHKSDRETLKQEIEKATP